MAKKQKRVSLKTSSEPQSNPSKRKKVQEDEKEEILVTPVNVGLIPKKEEEEEKVPLLKSDGFRNKEKVLILCSRGITFR